MIHILIFDFSFKTQLIINWMSNSAGPSNYASNRVGQSKSLWNYALSPGWNPQEVEILKIAVMKFGVGKWTDLFK